MRLRVEWIIKANADLPKEKRLSKEQVEALRKLTSPQSLVIVDGYTGTGKSSVLREAKKCWDGYDVIGMAIFGIAAERLEKATGIKSYTLVQLIGVPAFQFRGDLDKGALDTARHHLRMLGRAALMKPTWKEEPRVRLGRRSILVVDEAGMLSTPELLKLASACQLRRRQIGAGGGCAAAWTPRPRRPVPESMRALWQYNSDHDCSPECELA